MIPENLTYEQLIKDMKACEQTKGMSVLDHGEMVKDYYHDLYFHLYEDTTLRYEWKLPDWIFYYREIILSNLYNLETMSRYHVYHDIGKPYSQSIDDKGKRHFNDHSNVSYQIWKTLRPDDLIVQNLIKMDMDIHLLKYEGVNDFSNRPEAISLLITGLSELHANASIFDSEKILESTSFKIKWKQINKRGKNILKLLSENNA